MAVERIEITVPPRAVKVGLLGCGVVGSEVARQLLGAGDVLAPRVGAPLELAGIAVSDLARQRPGIDPALLTTDAARLVDTCDLVIELMGGMEPARSLILRALNRGAAVVTANKALLAADGPTLYAAAATSGADLYYEAAVAGAIPLVRPMRESLAGDRIERVMGIVNGTTNYVLDKMATAHLSLAEAVGRAQAKGFAEADPTADIEGFDAAAKCAILASLAFHSRVSIDDVYREGITAITADDVAWASRTGHVIKLLAIAEQVGDGIVARVHPALVPAIHPLASVRGSFNAIFVEAESAGELMFYGRGAGGAPTSSAVMGDVVSAAQHIVNGGRAPGERLYAGLAPLPVGRAVTRYQLRLRVQDRPGVLAAVSQLMADEGVSIETVRQSQLAEGPAGEADLLVGTHAAAEEALAATVAKVATADVVKKVMSVLRVEGA